MVLGSKESDDLWKSKAGRLDESAELSNLRKALGRPANQTIRIKLPASKRTAKAIRGREHRVAKYSASTRSPNAEVGSFHLRQTFVSRRPMQRLPPSVRSGARVAVWPKPKEVREIRGLAGAKYSRTGGVWTLPRAHPFLKTSRGRALSSTTARIAHLGGRRMAGRSVALAEILDFQRYVERGGRYRDKSGEVERDEFGLIVAGNIGSNLDERLAFWRAADRAERRRDARVQDRLIAELPHFVSASDRREILRRLGAVYDKAGLAWFGAVHRPDGHGDPRNFHLHLLGSTRPVDLTTTKSSRDSSDGEVTATFSASKDRTLQGPAWIRHLREKYAEILNDVCRNAAVRNNLTQTKIYYPGKLLDLGIVTKPSQHNGPQRSALRRRGEFIARSDGNSIGSLEDVLRRFVEGFAADTESLLEILGRDTTSDASSIATSPISQGSQIVTIDQAILATDRCANLVERLEALLESGPAGECADSPTLEIDLSGILTIFEDARVAVADAWIADARSRTQAVDSGIHEPKIDPKIIAADTQSEAGATAAPTSSLGEENAPKTEIDILGGHGAAPNTSSTSPPPAPSKSIFANLARRFRNYFGQTKAAPVVQEPQESPRVQKSEPAAPALAPETEVIKKSFDTDPPLNDKSTPTEIVDHLVRCRKRGANADTLVSQILPLPQEILFATLDEIEKVHERLRQKMLRNINATTVDDMKKIDEVMELVFGEFGIPTPSARRNSSTERPVSRPSGHRRSDR